MPKELFEIKQFESGNIYNADDRDIPNDAAVYSENIDPYGQSGSLMAIQADATAILANVDAKKMAIINDEETHRMVYVDNSDGDIKSIENIYANSPSINTLEAGSFGAGEIAALQANNKEIHMGLGKTRDPKWAGIISHGQFGANAPSGTQIENAELSSPSPFPVMHTVVNDSTNTFVYGIQENGNYVYKFDVSLGILVKRSDYHFTKTKAMCLGSDGNLWVLDEVSNNLKIIKIDPIEMDALLITDVNNFTNDTSVTDCIEIDDHLWMSCNVEVDVGSGSFLYNIEKSTIITGTTVSVVDRTPFLGQSGLFGGAINTGHWVSVTSGGTILPTFNIPKLPLSEPANSTGYCGIAMHVTTNGTSINSIKFAKAYSTGSPIYATTATWYLQLVKHDNTADSVSYRADGGSGGKVFPLVLTTTSPDEVFCVKGDDNSNKLSFIAQGSSNKSSIQLITKPEFSNTNGQNISKTSLPNNAGGNRDLQNMVGSATGDNYNLFSGAGNSRWATSNSSTVVAKLEGQVELTFAVDASIAGSLNLTANDHFYATSFIYDGYQESPLSSWTQVSGISGTNKSINVTISIFVGTLSKRVSHINLYRSSSTGSATVPTGFFRLIKTIKLNNGWIANDTNTSAPDWGNYYNKTINDTGLSYASYESRTGISEAVPTTLPKYGLSAIVNNFLYITDCSHPDIDNATNYVFKSQAFNFDQFNWVKDFLLLPNKATAMESFNGRLYVFSENETYVVNPDGMYIEDTIKGIGCRNQNGVVSSEIGMCFIDKNSIYLHNGQGINDIGAKIKKAHQIDDIYNSYSSLEKLCNYNTNDYSGDIVATYDSHRKAFCFFYTYKYTVSTSFTHSVSTTQSSEYITHGGSPSSTIQINQEVSGVGIPANTKIVNIDNNNRFEISNQATATGNIDLTITTTTFNYVPQCLVYTMPKNRWDVWNRVNSNISTDFNTHGAVYGKNNELLVSDTDNGLIQPFDPKSSTRVDNFKWYSKKFTMGESTTDKKLYKVEILSEDNSPTITVNTAENSTNYTALTDKKISRHAQVKIAVTGDSSATIDALRIVFRRLRRTKAMT